MTASVRFDPTWVSDLASAQAALAPANLSVSLAGPGDDVVSDATLKLVAVDDAGNRTLIYLYTEATLERIDPHGLKRIVDQQWPGRSLVVVHGLKRPLDKRVRELLMGWDPVRTEPTR